MLLVDWPPIILWLIGTALTISLLSFYATVNDIVPFQTYAFNGNDAYWIFGVIWSVLGSWLALFSIFIVMVAVTTGKHFRAKRLSITGRICRLLRLRGGDILGSIFWAAMFLGAIFILKVINP